MGGIEITAAAIIAAISLVGGWVWNLSSRLAKADGRIQSAEILASNASAKASTLGDDLAAHKEHVAAEYLSKDAMKEITEAINRLGDRLDNLFMHFIPKPGG